MLLECFPRLKSYAVLKAVRTFYDSWAYLIVVVGGMVLANLFAWELYLFYLYILLSLGAMFLMDDLRHMMPIIPCCYMSISRANNPAAGAASGQGVFYDPNFRIQLIFLICMAAVFLICRLVTILFSDKRRKGVPKLAIGFAALGLSYILGGVFSPYYSFKTAFFGFAQIASLCGFYFYFYYGVDWKTVPKDFFAKMFTVIGFGILFEIVGMYFASNIFETGQRAELFTGWGVYNNVGCAIAMCMPAPLYFTAKRKNGWIFLLLSAVIACGLILTQSRGSILFGMIVYLAALVCAIVASKGRERKKNLIAMGGVAVAAIIVLGVFCAIPGNAEKLLKLFSGITDRDFFNPSGRLEIYKNGLKQFAEAPLFGVGFYQCGAFRWGELPSNAFLPPRYHDTYVQLLASGGLFAMGCYLFHRFETVRLIFRRFSWEKLFCGLCCAALIATAIVDCHFFNFGPGLMYGILLVCAEGSDPVQPKQKKPKTPARV